MSQKPYKILIIDSDPSSLMFLDVNLSKFGYEVITSETTEQGLLLANHEQPSLIVCDINSQKMDGIEFCWMIRETSKVRSIPFILLATNDDPETHINGFRSGADAFILKPISMRAIITRIESLLWRVEQIQSAPSLAHFPDLNTLASRETFGLQGTLKACSLIEFMQFANMSKKSGLLKLEKAEESGQIGLKDGEVIFAKISDIAGEEAVYRMAGWQDGTFQFMIGAEPEDINIQKPTMKLILDCCSVLDMENIIVPKGS